MLLRLMRPLAVLLLPLILLAGCGDDPAAHRVEVIAALQGNAADLINGVDLIIDLPAGFVVTADSVTGEPAAGTVTSLLSNALVVSRYLPTGASSGGPALHILIADATGFAGNAPLVKVAAVYPPDSALPTSFLFYGDADVVFFDPIANTTIDTKTADPPVTPPSIGFTLASIKL